jgi:hypothetical protein
MTIEQTAKMCHEVNRAYCEAIGDHTQVPWNEAAEWQQDSAINGVMFHLNNPDARPQDSHANWYKDKLADGWKYGPVKDVQKKEHPCMVPYEELPLEQRVKDHLFIAMVKLCK